MDSFNTTTVVQLATKFLDRVEIKGLSEHHEFGYLISFFAALENKIIEIKEKESE